MISQATQEQYVCLWLGCKVHGRTSCSRSWLERHVLAHAGTKPFRCIVDGCGMRFNSQVNHKILKYYFFIDFFKIYCYLNFQSNCLKKINFCIIYFMSYCIVKYFQRVSKFFLVQNLLFLFLFISVETFRQITLKL